MLGHIHIVTWYWFLSIPMRFLLLFFAGGSRGCEGGQRGIRHQTQMVLSTDTSNFCGHNQVFTSKDRSSGQLLSAGYNHNARLQACSMGKSFLVFKNNIKTGRHDNLFLLFIWLYCVACGIFVLWPRIEPRPWQWKHRVLTTGPPGNSQEMIISRQQNPPRSLLNITCALLKCYDTSSQIKGMQITVTCWISELLNFFFRGERRK